MNSPDNCTRACRDEGFLYAGLGNVTDCVCSCKEPRFERPQDDSYCGLPCRGDNKFCGGIVGTSIYESMLVNSCFLASDYNLVEVREVHTIATQNSRIHVHFFPC